MRINLKSIIQNSIRKQMVSDTVYTKIVLDIISIIISLFFDGHIANGDVMITLEAVDTVMIATG
jgi:hypothetical protein